MIGPRGRQRPSEHVLSHAAAKTFYDRFGIKQDTQCWYEDAAILDLIGHAEFEQCSRVFEMGCGTGRLALNILQHHLPAQAIYIGMDVSSTMCQIAGSRLVPFAGRALVIHSDGRMEIPLMDQCVDRFIATYVLDLLSESDILKILDEAHRILRDNGRLCLVSLTQGNTFVSRCLCRFWEKLFYWRPTAVGGCRPIHLKDFINPHRWHIEHHHVLTQFGIASEILIASPIRN